MKKLLFLTFLISAYLPSCSKAEESFIHPSVRLTAEELDTTLVNLPSEIAAKIKSDRKDFLDKLIPLMENFDDLLILADKNHPLSSVYIPSDLADLDSVGIKVNKKGMKLRKKALDSLILMIKEAESENLDIIVSSAYRSYDYQEKIYNYYVSVYGQEETDKFSASPGTSQHQLGTAVDFGSITEEYADTAEGLWMADNCRKYGFSLSYPEGFEGVTGYNYEPWHYRYITKEGCILEQEYFGGVQQYMLEYLDENISLFREKTDNKPE